MKRVLYIIVGVIIIIGFAIFQFNGCESLRNTTPDDTGEFTADELSQESTANDITQSGQPEAQETQTETMEVLDIEIYKDAFIKANTEFTCEVLKDENYTTNPEIMKNDLFNSFEKHGLPTENDEIMIQILEAFDNDAKVINTIKEDAKKCADAN